MESRSMTSTGIVREVLTRYNYEEWKIFMKNYLRGKNLWDVVEGDFTLTPIDAQRDAKTLHIIQLSCEPNIFNQIKHFENAQTAWNHLAEVCRSDFTAQPHIRRGVASDDVNQHKDLYEFVEKGDWRGTRSYLREEPGAILWVPPSGRTVLHVATMEGHLRMVDGLVNLGKEGLVEKQDEDGNTALSLAAAYTGDVDIAKRIVNAEGGVGVLALPNNKGEIPLLLAANSGDKKMTRFLFLRTPPDILQQQSSRNRVLLLERCIQAHIFDVALKMLESYPELPTESLSYGFGGFHELARMSFAFSNVTNVTHSESLQTLVYNLTDGTLLDFALILLTMSWKLIIEVARGPILTGESSILHIVLQRLEETIFGQNKNEVSQILKYYKDSVANFNSSQLREASVNNAMLDAAKHGNVEFINVMKEANHDFLWAMDNHERGIFSYAVLYRKHNVFQLMQTLCGNKYAINYTRDMFGNNLLHLAAHLGPFSDLKLRPGAALQMQREIQWFKAVKEVVHPKCREERNDAGKKPEEIFIEAHKELMKEGEKWAKETAGTFAIVGVLVITVMFAAVFTVPGGYNQDTGVPIFVNKGAFTVFIISDAISLFASIIAVLIYIDIQTSRYAEIDFLQRLPSKIMSGLGFLSMSLVSMMVAFCAALAIVLQKSRVYDNLFAAVIVLAGVPFTLLIPSQLRLLLETFEVITSNPIAGSQKSTKQGFITRILYDRWFKMSSISLL